MFDYSKMRLVADRLLNRFNQKSPTGSGIRYIDMQPASGGTPDNPGTPTPVPYALEGVARGVSFKYVQSGLAVASDLQATVAVRDDVTPKISGFVELDGHRYKIVQVIPIPPVGVTVANRLIFRK